MFNWLWIRVQCVWVELKWLQVIGRVARFNIAWNFLSHQEMYQPFQGHRWPVLQIVSMGCSAENDCHFKGMCEANVVLQDCESHCFSFPEIVTKHGVSEKSHKWQNVGPTLLQTLNKFQWEVTEVQIYRMKNDGVHSSASPNGSCMHRVCSDSRAKCSQPFLENSVHLDFQSIDIWHRGHVVCEPIWVAFE